MRLRISTAQQHGPHRPCRLLWLTSSYSLAGPALGSLRPSTLSWPSLGPQLAQMHSCSTGKHEILLHLYWGIFRKAAGPSDGSIGGVPK